MINKISKTEAIKAKMKQEGKVTYLDQPKHIAAIVPMNGQWEAERREFQVKQRNAQITAATVILTA
jgi:undecaprenyl pyrophosphate synthase